MEIIWKTCHAPYEAYAVNNLGEIRGRKGGILKQFKMKQYRFNMDRPNKYNYVSLRRSADKSSYPVRVAPLICIAFHGPRPEGLQVLHIDENQDNNRPENLKWGTQSENIKASYRHGQRRPRRSRRHPLTVDQWNKIWELHAQGMSQVRIGFVVGCHNSAVSKILSGRVKGPRQVSLCSNEEWLRERVAEGLSIRRIAQLAGITESNASYAVKRLKKLTPR